MVDVEGTVMDHVKVVQQQALAVICPLAGSSCLYEHEHSFHE